MSQNILCSQEFDAEHIRCIRVDCRVARIRVNGCAGSAVRISWYDTEYRRMKIGVTNGVLSIAEEDSAAFYELFGFLEMVNGSDFLKELRIEIPYQFAGSKIILNTQVNGIDVWDLSFPGILEAVSRVREVLLAHVRADSVHVKTESGQISARNIFVRDAIRLRVTTGNIFCEIDDDPKDYMLQCASQVGICDVPHCGGRGNKRVEASSDTGNITIRFAA